MTTLDQEKKKIKPTKYEIAYQWCYDNDVHVHVDKINQLVDSLSTPPVERDSEDLEEEGLKEVIKEMIKKPDNG